MLRRKTGNVVCSTVKADIFPLGNYCVFCCLNYLCLFLYSEYIIISLVTTVLLGCVLRGFRCLLYNTRVLRSGTRPPKQPTGVYIAPSPRFCQLVASPLTRWRPR